MTVRKDVAAFLHLFKGCVMLGRYHVRSRAKNRQALLDLDMSAEERRQVLLRLEPEDYVSGPTPDHTNSTLDVWEFGKTVGGTAVYIKLRVAPDPCQKNAHHALVWSFHAAERALKYPLKGGES